VNFHGSPAQYRRPAPCLGQHTLEVLQDFGFDSAEIDRLLSMRVVAGMDRD
jgi:crotonobetainyl-CoA:carnitine CoA-transferase CaiB-like acyl-CoA transferase